MSLWSEMETMAPQPINCVALCRSIVGLLLQQREIAIDFEGVNLCRKGRLSIMQVCTSSDDIFIFDITTMGARAFDKGRLRELLQSTSVRKVIFDGRSDNDALHHLYNAGMKNVFDLQIQFAFKNGNEGDQYLKGLEYCLQNSNLNVQISGIKEMGKRIFSPAHGGNFSSWERRPLHPDLLSYAATDVKYMLPMKRNNEQGSMRKRNERIEDLTQERIDAASTAASPASGRHMALQDFRNPVGRFNELAKEIKACGIPEHAINPGPIDGMFCIYATEGCECGMSYVAIDQRGGCACGYY